MMKRVGNQGRQTTIRIFLPCLLWALLAGCIMAQPASPSPAKSPSPTISQRLKAESAEALAADAREKGSAVRGAILFTQQKLACTRCHVAGAANPVGPDLNQLPRDTTGLALVESLLEPSKSIKKGFNSSSIVTTAGKIITGRIVEDRPERIIVQTSSGNLDRVTLARTEIDEIVPSDVSTMPDSLMDQLSSREQFLDLVRYLMELAAADKGHATPKLAMGGKSIDAELQGIVLLKDFNCAACHNDDVTGTQLTDKQAPNLLQSINGIDASFVKRFIADPHTVRPGTTMPHVMGKLSADEREIAALEITHYLVSLRKPAPDEEPPRREESGTEESDTEQSRAEMAARGSDLFHSGGCVACHSPRADDHRELLSESSVLLGNIVDKYQFEGLVNFLKDPLKVRPSGRMPQMKLTHFEAVDLATYLFSNPRKETGSKLQAEPERFEMNSAVAERGQKRFVELGCRQCHQLDTTDVKPTSRPLSELRTDQGCLSGKQGQWPTFALSVVQRSHIQLALQRKSDSLSSQDEIGITLTAYRCLNCHQRDDLGGVATERDSYFQTENPNLGPQGRIPPALTNVGAKLEPQWMRQVLVSGRSIRPYVKTRMPQYGTINIEHLIDLFQQSDQLPPVEYAKFDDQKEMRKIGSEMVGTSGLNCIVCHTYQLKQAANMPAVDLTEMAERLKKDWFYHYMHDPQRLSPGTIMPSFWPGGKALRQDILAGDRDLQVEALWQYLLDGRQAPAPRGLIQEPMELLAKEEAVMLRRSYPNIGKRGIGVGYPHQVNLAFDAEQMRLAMIWSGPFADPGGVWRSQGHGRVRTLGDAPIAFAPGPDLDSAASPWSVDESRPPQHSFKGYSLDDKMRPRFRYLFDDLSVEDYVVDLIDSKTGHAFLRRTLKLHADKTPTKPSRDGLIFRAATGKLIEHTNDDGVFLVDKRLRVRIPNRIRARSFRWEKDCSFRCLCR